ncbi:Protein of unknown function [Streptosporangium canum]|uniref:DUF3987 domain-containing protein n=1 Tax=Streptosporangium canum TaxID=324952 RepID=A0A1I3L8W2_9ACTN|nr:DUF3987 domain-containing protein [Streptosporangium canum]SFI81252.1 Protein of unknown function [Streptosporangium canum]
MSNLTNKMPEPDLVMFTGPIGKMVNELDPFTEGSKVGVLTTLLAGFSAAVGNLPGVGTGKGSMNLSFWPVLVGPTGVARKGTATGIAMKVLTEGLGTFGINNVVYGCPATGLGFAAELSERAIRGVAAPVLFIEEEMDTFISNSKRDTKIGTYLRKAWDGATINHRTSQTDLVIMKPHVAIVGHVQPKNWGAISGSKDATGGTYNRFFPVWVMQSKKLPVFATPNPEEIIKKLGNRFRQMVNFAQEVTDLVVPDDVAEVFEHKHREICDALTTGNEELGQYTERAMAYMIRIAGLYCLADKRTELKVADFDAALALVHYMVETVTYTLPEAESDGSDIPARILAYIREAGPEGATSTEVARKFQRVRAAEIRAITDACVQIKTTKMRSEGGRPATLFTWVEEIAEEDQEQDPKPLLVA